MTRWSPRSGAPATQGTVTVFGAPAILPTLLSEPEKTKPSRLLQTEGPLAGPRVRGLSCADARWLSPPGDQALARRAAPQGALSIRLGPAMRDPSGGEIVAGAAGFVNATLTEWLPSSAANG